MPASQNRKLAALLFVDMNARFPTEGRDESLGDFQVRDPRSGWAEANPKTKSHDEN